jgi:hypothetical protein
MWQPLSQILEAIGQLRVPLWKFRIKTPAGHPAASDAKGEMYWKRYLSAEVLYDVWGPVPGSPWESYHCVTLFAALDRLLKTGIGPTDPSVAAQLEENLGNPAMGKVKTPGWAGPGVFALIDLPGPQSVTLGAHLIRSGMQPICTFDNWPHPAGLLSPEKIVPQLLRYASLIDSQRHLLSPTSPPVWLCDRNRFGFGPGKPRDFDNRYYLDDSVLPGADILRASGIETVICVVPTSGEILKDDLRFYFATLKQHGFNTLWTHLTDPELRLMELAVRPHKKPAFQEFKRSSAGGFGAMIPEPSSGSGG